MPEEILVSEIFGPTIQGEGALIGKPTLFVRTAGCDYRCTWCDTLYAVLPEFKDDWRRETAQGIFDEIIRLSSGKPMLVTISGGNPALQPIEPLLDLGRASGYTFALETQASVAKPWFSKLQYLVLSPKPPSSGEKAEFDVVQKCLDWAPGVSVSMKVVVFDEADYAFARAVFQRFPEVPFFLQAGTELAKEGGPAQDSLPHEARGRIEWLLGKVMADGWTSVTLLPQLHVLLWGRKRGV